jgi:hypothetical protein
LALAPWAGGSKLAVTNIDIATRTPQVSVIDLASGKATVIRSFARNDLAYGVAWSPDQSTLAITTFKTGVHLINADGSDDRELGRPPFGEYDISPGSFSPDGRLLAVSWQADFKGPDEASLNRGFLFHVGEERDPHPIPLAAKGSVDGPFVWMVVRPTGVG